MKLLTTSFRILSRFRLYSIINTLGLMISLACVIALSRYVHQELTVNRFIDNLDRVCITIREHENRPTSLGSAININNLKDFVTPLDDPAVKLSSELIHLVSQPIFVNNHQFEANLLATDSAFLQIITYPIISGSGKMSAPEDVIITEQFAKRLFGKENPIGQKIRYAMGDILNVVGVLGSPKTKSSLNFDILINKNLRNSWMRMSYDIVLLHTGVNLKTLNKKYSTFQSPSQLSGKVRFQLKPLSELYFSSSMFFNQYDKVFFLTGNKNNVLTLSIVAFLILLVGLFNFINIYTVISLRRAREFGVKKIYGANVWQIFGQVYLENFLLALAAVFGAWLMLEISGEILSNKLSLIIQSNIQFDVLLSLSILFLLPLITSAYPFFRYYYSKPITSLRSVSVGGVSVISRSVFLFLQYTITFSLIVISIYFIKQLNFMLDADLGYNPKDIIVSKMLYEDSSYDIRDQSEYEKRRSRHQEIIATIERKMNASTLFSDWMFGDVHYTIDPFTPLSVGKDEYEKLGFVYISRKQMNLFGYQLLEGRLWDSTDISAQYRFIINESAKKLFNITDIRSAYLQPESRLWYGQGDMGSNPAYEIVGVVKDFNTGHLSRRTTPTVIAYEEEYMKRENVIAKVAPGKSEEAIEFLRNLSTELYGERHNFKFAFMEDEVTKLYEEDKRVSRVYTTFSIIAIFISCLGLFALSLFDIRQRYREIALRKINGATSKDIMHLLIRKYTYLLAASFVVAVPVSYFVISKYMESFAHRTAISWWLFVISLVVVTAVSLLTLLWQVKRAMKINPAHVLKGD